MAESSQIIRYDQRDALVYRAQLVLGSQEYESYYSRHPEFKEMDDKIRKFYDSQSQHERRIKVFPDERLAAAWVLNTKKSVVHILRNSVDGPANPERIQVNPEEVSLKIKGLAKYLGAGIVGVCKLNQAWVYSHCGQLASDEWGKPINLPHKYAIVMGFAHTWDIWLREGKVDIPGYMDNWHCYHLMSAAAVRLAAAIRDMGYPARASIQSNYTCLMPPLAVDAGLGEQCLIGICLSKEYGLAYRLCAVTTDLPLLPDPPADLGIDNFCIRCRKCVDACPSGALSLREKVEINGRMVWKQDVYRCFRYWSAMGVTCGICRRVCPWSKPRTRIHKGVANLAIHLPAISPILIAADKIIYGKKPRYNPFPAWLLDNNENLVKK